MKAVLMTLILGLVMFVALQIDHWVAWLTAIGLANLMGYVEGKTT